MLPRKTCSQCNRVITVNRDGQLRSHFCPHYRPCESGDCVLCQDARDEAVTDAANNPLTNVEQ